MLILTSTLISRALALIGVKSNGNNLKGEQANNAMYALNEIGDSLNSDADMIYAQQTITFDLANVAYTQPDGVRVYTIGPSANATCNVAQRPQYISFAAFQMKNTGLPFLDRPIRILGAEEWAAIRLKNIQSTVSYYLYYDKQYPLGNIFLWPQPNIDANLSLTCEVALPSTLTMSTMINLPPGYARLLRYELACNQAPEYGKPIPPDVSGVLANIKRQLKVTNLKHRELSYSPEAQGSRQSGAYDIYTDEIL